MSGWQEVCECMYCGEIYEGNQPPRVCSKCGTNQLYMMERHRKYVARKKYVPLRCWYKRVWEFKD